jgi:hypothetical protein
MAQAQRAEAANDEQRTSARPIKIFKQGGVEVSLWRNSGEKGDMYNTTIRNSYKDENSGEWKETSSFSPTDLAVVAQLKRSPSGDFFPPSPLRLSLYLASCAGTPRLP